VVERVTKIEMIFLYQWWWESGCSGRMVGGGGADSVLQFQLKRGDDMTKSY
jgi:hypothetical protein